MKAILVDEERNLHWSDVADPVVGPEDVLVKIQEVRRVRQSLPAHTIPRKMKREPV